jgi:hypothetical protein
MKACMCSYALLVKYLSEQKKFRIKFADKTKTHILLYVLNICPVLADLLRVHTFPEFSFDGFSHCCAFQALL